MNQGLHNIELTVWLGFGALTGPGKSVMMVPLLTQVRGVDIRHPAGASLDSVIATSSGAAAAYPHAFAIARATLRPAEQEWAEFDCYPTVTLSPST